MNLYHELITIDLVNEQVSKEDLLSLFSDLDFTENEEYFREDTLSLGYKSEADRIVTELLEKDMVSSDMIEYCLDKQFDRYDGYLVNAIRVDDTIIVSYAYVSE